MEQRPQSPMDIGYGASAFLLGNEVQSRRHVAASKGPVARTRGQPAQFPSDAAIGRFRQAAIAIKLLFQDALGIDLRSLDLDRHLKSTFRMSRSAPPGATPTAVRLSPGGFASDFPRRAGSPSTAATRKLTASREGSRPGLRRKPAVGSPRLNPSKARSRKSPDRIRRYSVRPI